MNNNIKTNLFSIGGMRCGSTTLWHYLTQHPDIYMPKVKEPDYFVAEYYRVILQQKKSELTEVEIDKAEQFIKSGKHRTRDTYNSLYINSTNEKYLGDSSHYLYHPYTAKLIHDTCETSKILVCLRNPIERIFSEYMYYTRENKINCDFNDFVKNGTTTIGDKISISQSSRLQKGFYHELLTPWFKIFDRDRVKVILFEDLTEAPQQTFDNICSWLKITCCNTRKVHSQKSGRPRNRFLTKIVLSNNILSNNIKKLVPASTTANIRNAVYSFLLKQEKINPNTKKFLIKVYKKDIHQLESLINRKLDHWIEY